MLGVAERGVVAKLNWAVVPLISDAAFGSHATQHPLSDRTRTRNFFNQQFDSCSHWDESSEEAPPRVAVLSTVVVLQQQYLLQQVAHRPESERSRGAPIPTARQQFPSCTSCSHHCILHTTSHRNPLQQLAAIGRVLLKLLRLDHCCHRPLTPTSHSAEYSPETRRCLSQGRNLKENNKCIRRSSAPVHHRDSQDHHQHQAHQPLPLQTDSRKRPIVDAAFLRDPALLQLLKWFRLPLPAQAVQSEETPVPVLEFDPARPFSVREAVSAAATEDAVLPSSQALARPSPHTVTSAANAAASPAPAGQFDPSSSSRPNASFDPSSLSGPNTNANPQPPPPSSQRRRPYNPSDYLPRPPFSRRSGALDALGRPLRPLRRLSAARLWNPTNSTPRGREGTAASTRRPRRQSTPPPPAIPLSHPILDASAAADSVDPAATGNGDYPLLSLPEQRQTRHSTSTRASVQVERAGVDRRISLPLSVRHSYDEKGGSASAAPSPNPSRTTPEAGPSEPKFRQQQAPQPHWASADSSPDHDPDARWGPVASGQSRSLWATAIDGDHRPEAGKLDKGKGKAVMPPLAAAANDEGPRRSADHAPPLPRDQDDDRDLERGPDHMGQGPQRRSTASVPDGIGSAISSSNSSIMGDPDQQVDVGEEWGPQHPCFPHLNPHVPLGSPEHASTRIIRIRRDWLLEGDLAPTFSNLYPEILDPAGLPEQEFRRIIEKLNGELIPIFNPYNWRNIFDGFMGLLTGWLWEDMGFSSAKHRLARLEAWLEQWNKDMEKTVGSEEGTIPPKILPLRQTGYMSLDIQIGDPEIAPAQPTPAPSRSGLPVDTAAAGSSS